MKAELIPVSLTVERAQDYLSLEQLRVLDSLVEGRSLIETSRKTGVHRVTIYRWLKSDPIFRVAYEMWLAEMRESTHYGLLRLAADALKTVANGVQQGDHKLAYAVLKDLGAFKQPDAEFRDPRMVNLEMEARRAGRERVLMEQIHGGPPPAAAPAPSPTPKTPGTPAASAPPQPVRS